MPLNFLGFLIQNTIENTTICSRVHLMNLVEQYPAIVYPRLDIRLKTDPDILESVFFKHKRNFNLIKYIPKELQKDEIFLLRLLGKNELALGIIDEMLLADMEFVKKVIFTNSKTAFYLYDQFKEIYKKDKNEYDEIESIFKRAKFMQNFELAGKYNGLVEFLKLHSKGEVSQLSINKIELDTNSYNQLKYLPDYRFEREDFLNFKITDEDKKRNPDIMNYKIEPILYCPNLFRNDKEVVLKLIEEELFLISINKPIEHILSNLSDTLKNDQDIAMKVLNKNGLFLDYFSDEIKSNAEIVKVAIENNFESYFMANVALRKYSKEGVNKELLLKIINRNAYSILHVNKDWLKDDDVLSIIKKDTPFLFNLINK